MSTFNRRRERWLADAHRRAAAARVARAGDELGAAADALSALPAPRRKKPLNTEPVSTAAATAAVERWEADRARRGEPPSANHWLEVFAKSNR